MQNMSQQADNVLKSKFGRTTMISTKLKQYLEDAGVAYTRHPHRTAYTSQEIAQSVHVPGREMVKAVILKVDEGPLVMAVVSANDAANLDILREEIGCSVLRLATEKEFSGAFPTCKSGAMPPFGNLFIVPTYCDTALTRNGEIEFNAGSHDETIRMAFDDYKRLVNPQMVRFAQPYHEGVQRLAA
jgi:Ala-tRNA(Pro) deacylase